jgi:CDP-glucose 4,6-dehydratase
VESLEMSDKFWAGKRVLLTGHTGFKGAWMAFCLTRLSAKVTGVALAPEGAPNLSQLLASGIKSITADIRDADTVKKIVHDAAPDIVIHMAAQALVRRSYREPMETFSTNVMGTAHVLEALQGLPQPVTALIVTTDKVYRNAGKGSAFREDDPLGGDDPYSASKAAAEMAVHSWRESYPSAQRRIASVRAGNVIGGGDFSEDRLIPDIYRAFISGEPLVLRYPKAVRPWQHVLDTLFGYLTYIKALSANDVGTPLALNLGPAKKEAVTVENVLKSFERALGKKVPYRVEATTLPEKETLLLDTGLAEKTIKWQNHLSMDEAVRWTADWYAAFHAGKTAQSLCEKQFEDYYARMK